MKAILILIAVFSLMSCGDLPSYKTYSEEKRSDGDVIRFGNFIPDLLYIRKFSYEGHNYLSFSRPENNTILHDPNCKCFKKDSIK